MLRGTFYGRGVTSDPNRPERPRLRLRQPRYSRFLATGVAAGLLVALVVSRLVPADARYSRASVLLYVGLLAALVGALLGGLLAVLLERGDRSGEAGGRRDLRRARRR